MNNYTENILITDEKIPKGFFRFPNLELICLASLILGTFFSDANEIFSGQVKLRWDANTEADLAGYKLYYGTSSGNYEIIDDVGNVTTHTISNLVKGVTYFFVLTAYDTSINESGFSEELIYSVPMDDVSSPVNLVPILLNLTLNKNSAGKSTLPDDVVVTVKDHNGDLMSGIITKLNHRLCRCE